MSKKSEDLTAPDQFISFSDKAAEWIAANWTILAIIGGLGIAVLTANVSYNAYTKHVEKSAYETYYHADVIEREMTKMATAKDAKDKPVASKTDKTQELKAKFMRVIEEHPKSNAASMAAIKVADLFLEDEAADKAIGVLNKALEGSTQKVMKALVKTKLSSAYLAAGKSGEAESLLSEIISDKDLESMHPEVKIKLALTFENQEKYTEAKELYDSVTKDHADTQSARRAKKFLNLMKFEGHIN